MRQGLAPVVAPLRYPSRSQGWQPVELRLCCGAGTARLCSFLLAYDAPVKPAVTVLGAPLRCCLVLHRKGSYLAGVPREHGCGHGLTSLMIASSRDAAGATSIVRLPVVTGIAILAIVRAPAFTRLRELSWLNRQRDASDPATSQLPAPLVPTNRHDPPLSTRCHHWAAHIAQSSPYR